MKEHGPLGIDPLDSPIPNVLRFEKFVCENERIATLTGMRAPAAPPPPGFANDKIKNKEKTCLYSFGESIFFETADISLAVAMFSLKYRNFIIISAIYKPSSLSV